MSEKPENYKKLQQELRLAIFPLKLDTMKEVVNTPGCHPDIWMLEPDLTPLQYLVKNTIPSRTLSVDDDDGTAAAKMLIDAGANVIHKINVYEGTNTVLQTAEKHLKGKEQNYPKLFQLLREADAVAKAKNQ
jgi:hypothetical protein